MLVGSEERETGEGVSVERERRREREWAVEMNEEPTKKKGRNACWVLLEIDQNGVVFASQNDVVLFS